MNEPMPSDLESRADELTSDGGDSVQSIHRRVMDEIHGGQPSHSARATPLSLDAHGRELAEPRDGFEPVPFWLAILSSSLLVWGGLYIGIHSGPMTDTLRVGVQWDDRPITLAEFPFFASNTYDRSNLYPSLGGADDAAKAPAEPNPTTVAELLKEGSRVYTNVCAACHQPHGNGNPAQGVPPLNGSEWVVGDQASAARLSRLLLYGLNGPITVKGRPYNGQMPAQGSALKDWQIAAVATYIRNSWENQGDPDDAKPVMTAAVVRAARDKEPGRSTAGTAPMTAAELLAIPVAANDAVTPGPTAPSGPSPGELVFQANSCLSCHQVNGQGGQVGPDLTGIGARVTPESLRESILNPNAKISQGYEAVRVVTLDGQSMVGVVRAQNAGKLTLVGSDGKDLVIPLDDIDEQRAASSLMPTDFGTRIQPKDLDALVDYLMSLKTAPKP